MGLLYPSSLYTAIAIVRLHPASFPCRTLRSLAFNDPRPVEKDRFSLTQDYLASKLEVRRTRITVAAGSPQKAGLIRYNRGIITIPDRPGLKKAACACYRVITDEFNRLLGSI